jgi:uncharacterized protein (DUF2342 family)
MPSRAPSPSTTREAVEPSNSSRAGHLDERVVDHGESSVIIEDVDAVADRLDDRLDFVSSRPSSFRSVMSRVYTTSHSMAGSSRRFRLRVSSHTQDPSACWYLNPFDG